MTCEESFSSLLELAANDEIEAFKNSIQADPSAADRPGLWYGRKKGSSRMVLEHRTPLMVAATYGSTDVLSFLLSLPSINVNRRCGPDNVTALHCAASGGSSAAVQAAHLLLAAGADRDAADSEGRRPADVIAVPSLYPDTRTALEQLLGRTSLSGRPETRRLDLHVSIYNSSSSTSPPLSASSPDEDGGGGSPTSDSSDSSPYANHQKKEYPVDPTLPDIKSSIYATDEFRMFSFKVRPCSRAYSHDWTECPFVHPGENARRRDPRKYHYSCVPCPDFRRGGTCRRGDMCEYAHGVFESWLHPAQYRTRLCKDGPACDRRVCFFAHASDELRPLYVSTGSAVPSPRSAISMEMAAAALGLVPGSPSSPNHFTPPVSPSWAAAQQSNSNVQMSRLRSSLSARDVPVDELALLLDLETQQLNDLCLSSNQAQAHAQAQTQARLLSPMVGARPIRPKPLAPANLDELFSSEVSLSPRFSVDQGQLFSPTHKSGVLNHRLLSPINTNTLYSPKGVDTSLMHPTIRMSPPGGHMSPRSLEAVSPMSSSRLAILAQREKLLGSVISPVSNNSPWAKMASPLSKVDWSANGEDLGHKLGPELGHEEPDVSWVNSLVNPPELREKQQESMNGGDSSNQSDGLDQTVIGAWLEQMQLDQIKQ